MNRLIGFRPSCVSLALRSCGSPAKKTFCTPILHPSFSRSFIPSLTKYQEQQLQQAQKESCSEILPKFDLSPLKFEQDLYVTLRIHNRPYLVTLGDKVVLPFKLKHAEIGDVLKFNDVTSIGSRNYTVTGDPIDPSLFSIKAVVIEKTKNPMYTKEITKRRQRHVRHVNVKHDITILRISELSI
ncbi:hypothetical protein PACTADRAFT_50799 [Pachysolen tannophilus NRRL Y-2460]|uniref:Large ribosomal subunit protein bL21m n=1 Tax=Pachysolen tannophilus NRRL Y-2460 TaxID=669874 RepID=A0A1E4TT92_PACTA|nr:hypothetical protein PACTADRAFT_50799 [Pachysolen tannophilus NRRL Y-2460]